MLRQNNKVNRKAKIAKVAKAPKVTKVNKQKVTKRTLSTKAHGTTQRVQMSTMSTPKFTPLSLTSTTKFTPLSTSLFTFQAPQFSTFSTKSSSSSLMSSKLSFNNTFSTPIPTMYNKLSPALTSQLSQMKLTTTPITTQKRGFLGGLGNLFGKKKEEGASSIGPMQMMEMMGQMQKFQKAFQSGSITEKDYEELGEYIEKLKQMNGGKLPAQVEPLLAKIQSRQPISQHELAAMTGLTPEEMTELRELTMGMKDGKVNTMEYFMKAATIMQRAGERMKAPPTASGEIEKK